MDSRELFNYLPEKLCLLFGGYKETGMRLTNRAAAFLYNTHQLTIHTVVNETESHSVTESISFSCSDCSTFNNPAAGDFWKLACISRIL